MGEVIFLRTIGGPHEANARSIDLEALGWEWPLPEILVADDPRLGHYRKITESQHEGPYEKDFVKRGVEYEWIDAFAPPV